jgi:hypothetical protein
MANRQRAGLSAKVKKKRKTGLFEGIKPIYRLGMALFAVSLGGLGVLDVLGGRTNYFNPWGHLVFAPSLILIGLSLIVATIFAW